MRLTEVRLYQRLVTTKDRTDSAPSADRGQNKNAGGSRRLAALLCSAVPVLPGVGLTAIVLSCPRPSCCPRPVLLSVLCPASLSLSLSLSIILIRPCCGVESIRRLPENQVCRNCTKSEYDLMAAQPTNRVRKPLRTCESICQFLHRCWLSTRQSK